MKMHRLPVLLGVIMLMIALSLLIYGYRLYVYTIQHPFVPAMVGLSLKVLINSALIGFSVCLYRLLMNYRKKSFFDSNSVRFMRWIGYTALFVAVLHSVVLAMESPEFGGSVGAFVGGAISKFVLESPLMLLVGLLTYLLADFMQKAIAVKNDNESFI